ncbi:MAG: type I methionyl aminopeptidase [Candidatus Omnitrophota bacterium]
MIPLKSKEDLENMRCGGRILAGIMKRIENFVRAGVTTLEIDRFAQELAVSENVMPAFKGYKGYPAVICTSVNEEIVHGIPSARKLKSGDIVSLDLGINYQGFFCDAAITVAVGIVDSQVKKLIEVTKKSLSDGIRQARVDRHLTDISYAIQNCAESNGFSVVRQFVGHGIGKSLHEEPEIPNFGRPRQGPVLKNGMVLAIEPMVNMGGWESEIMEDGWTAVTKDRLPSAHFEHTVAVTEVGPEILTRN